MTTTQTTNEAADRLRREMHLAVGHGGTRMGLDTMLDAVLATERRNAHPRTYSLVGTPRLFLVTDDESGINIGYADKIGGPLVRSCCEGEDR